jgi:hypothetical protein
VFPTDPSLATPSSLSQHHNIPPPLSAASSPLQLLQIQSDLSLQTPGLSSASLRQASQDRRLSPKTPERELGRNLHRAYFDSTKNTPTSLNHHEFVRQRLSYQSDTSSSQRYQFPDSRHEGPEQHVQLTSVSTSPASSSSAQPSPEPGKFVQISPQHVPSRSRRKQDRQLKCTSCSRVFPRRCDLK